MDLATLGLAVTSSPVVEATERLDRFAQTAQKAEAAADKMGAGASASASKVGASSRATDQFRASLQNIERVLLSIDGRLASFSRGAMEARSATVSVTQAVTATAVAHNEAVRSIDRVTAALGREKAAASEFAAKRTRMCAPPDLRRKDRAMPRRGRSRC